MYESIEESRLANSNLTVVLLRRNATVMFMGAARTWLEISHVFSIPIFCNINEDMDCLLCMMCKCHPIEETKGLSSDILNFQILKLQTLRASLVSADHLHFLGM